MKRFLLILALLHPWALGPRAEETSGSGELSLPWQAFEKLLKLGQDDVLLTWDEFQKLLKQTGAEEAPPYQMQEGKVSLSRAEFKRLLDRMKPPAADAGRYFLTKAVYAARVGQKSARVEALLRLQIPGDGGEIPPLRVPLFPGTPAFQEVLVDGRPALIESGDGQTTLTIVRSGEHEIKAVFSVPGSWDKAPHQIHFPVPRTPITRLELTLPLKDVEVTVPNASQVETSRSGGNTVVTASFPVGDSVSASWNPRAPEEQKGPAKVYSVVHNLLSVEEDALRVTARLELEILQNTVNAVNVRVPEGYTVLDVQGDAVGEWKAPTGDKPVLVIPLTYARQGRFDLTITAEQLLKEKSGVARYDGFQVISAVRENGFLGIELKTTAEARVLESPGLVRLDVQELPPSILGLTQRPLIYGFKFARQPFRLDLDIQRHQEVAVISTVVDDANGVTLVMEDGKRVHHLTYTVRNTWKQFLELSLPKDAQVWTAFVEGRPVKPSRNADGKVLIPLNRSRAENGDLSPFDVEVMYYQGRGSLAPAGRLELDFPAPDVVVSRMLWSVYLPVNCDYPFFGGSVDREKQAEGLAPLLDVVRGKRRVLKDIAQSIASSGYDMVESKASSRQLRRERVAYAKSSDQWQMKGDFDDAQGVDEEAYALQVEREMNFFNQVNKQQAAQSQATTGEPGVLPIRVQVPNTGQVFRFSKRIVVDQVPVDLKVVFVKRWMTGLLKLVFLGFLLWGAYRIRMVLAAGIQTAKAWAVRYEKEWRWALSPVGLVAASFAVMVAASFLSRFLTVLAVLGFVGAVGRLVWFKLEEKRSAS